MPAFPLPARVVFHEFEDMADMLTEQARERELELWEWAWRQPQGAAWAREPWRLMSIAMWVRTYVVCESSTATAADKGSLHRFADQIGMTPAGLRENGWQIVPLAEEPEAPKAVAGVVTNIAERRRLRG